MDKGLRAIHSQFEKLEDKKREIFDLLNSITADQLYQNPDAHTWSVYQVTRHLFTSETNSLLYLKKKLSYPDTVPHYTPKSWGGVMLIKMVYLFHIKIKAPDGIDMWKITEKMSIEELKMKWDELRKNLISFIENQYPRFGKHLAFRHPFAGRMTMYQMLIFMNDHMNHHQKQMQRILRQIEPAKA